MLLSILFPIILSHSWAMLRTGNSPSKGSLLLCRYIVRLVEKKTILVQPLKGVKKKGKKKKKPQSKHDPICLAGEKLFPPDPLRGNWSSVQSGEKFIIILFWVQVNILVFLCKYISPEQNEWVNLSNYFDSKYIFFLPYYPKKKKKGFGYKLVK